MILTKVLGLTGVLTKNKTAKILILLIEIAILAYAISQNEKKEEAPQKLLNR